MLTINQSVDLLSEQIEALIDQQIEAGIVHDYFKSGVNGSGIHYLNIDPNNEFICQVNPKRDPAKRGLLKTGKKGCFLCEENMPDEEDGIRLGSDWKLYPNPRPYERNHTVLVKLKKEGYHPFQLISNKEDILKALEIIWKLAHVEGRGDYNLTFNSTNAGASSRHFHFQLFECHLPIMDFGVAVMNYAKVRIGEVKDYPAGVLVIEGRDKEDVASKTWEAIDRLNTYWKDFVPYVLLFKVVDGQFRVYIFPRAAESPAELNPELINTKFGVCEMSGMTIVYKDDMVEDISLDIFTESLKAASNLAVFRQLKSML